MYYISTQPFSTTYKHYYKIISQGNGIFVAYTPCFKCHVHNKLAGLRMVHVGIGFIVCIINWLITPVGNVLIRLGCQGKGTKIILMGNDFFQTCKLSSQKPYLCLVTHSYSDKIVLIRIQYFITSI